MLEYTLNDKPFLLNRNTSVEITWYNPACFTNDFPGDLALGIEIPENPHNRALLQNPGRYEKYSSGNDREYPGFEIRCDGALLISGTLVITTAPGMYSGWCRSNLGTLGKEQREKKITDMPWPTAQTFVHKASYDDSTDDYGIQPLINQGFWEGKGREEKGTITYLDENGDPATREDERSAMQKNAIDNYTSWINVYDLGNILPGCVISPFLHLRYVIRKSLELNKWFINRNDMIDAKYNISWLKNLKVYNTFGIIDVSITSTISKKIREWNYDTNQFDEYFVDSFNPGWTAVAPFNYADLLPRVSYKYFLLGIQNSLNYVFRFRNDNKVDIIDRNEILNAAPISIQKYHVGGFDTSERVNVRLKFLPEFDKNDSKYSAGFTDLSDRFADYGEPVDTFDDLALIASPAFGELRLVKDTNKIYEYTWMVVTDETVESATQVDAVGWQFASSGPQPYVYGTEPEEEEIKSAISTLQQLGGGTNYLEAFQKGNIRSMRSLYADFTLRLIPGNMTVHPKSLYWEGETGLFANRWQTWARFWKNRLPLTTQFQFPAAMVFYVAENITEPFSIDEGEFIIEKMTTTFGMNRVGKTTINIFKK